MLDILHYLCWDVILWGALSRYILTADFMVCTSVVCVVIMNLRVDIGMCAILMLSRSVLNFVFMIEYGICAYLNVIFDVCKLIYEICESELIVTLVDELLV